MLLIKKGELEEILLTLNIKLSSLEKSKLFLKTIKVRYNLTLEDEKDNIKEILKQFERHVKKYSKLKQNKLVAELKIWRNEVGIKLPGNLPVATSSSSIYWWVILELFVTTANVPEVMPMTWYVYYMGSP